MTAGYDIIGDIHGQAEKLKALLYKMGYRVNADGYFAHAERQAIFVGDFVDRHPRQKEVLDIVRPMVENGAARAVMGNHEFNAICFATAHPEGGYVRAHTEKNKHQHQSFLDEFPHGSAEHTEQIEWFKTLPVYIDLKDIFIIHACWHKPSMDIVQPYLNTDGTLIDKAYLDYAKEDTAYFKALEMILKGPEHELPDPVTFKDGGGVSRNRARVRWWKDNSMDVLERLEECGAAQMSAEEVAKVNQSSICAEFNQPSKPTFIGHYWMSGTPEPLSDTICCVDYSAAKGGDLVSYRWSGESTLVKHNFIW